MRLLLLAATLALALTAGCLDDEGDDGSGDDAGGPSSISAANGTAPEPMHWDGAFSIGASPANIVTGEPCGPASTCDFRDFTTDGTFDLTATLSWGLEANDLDLYLYQGDTQLSSDGINTIGAVPPDLPVASQVMHVPGLPPGDYTFWVVAWNAVDETYELDAEFALS